MKIQIFGTGCPKCKKTEANTNGAVKNMGIDANVEKVTDINKIAEYGVLATPALAIDGKIVFSGKIPAVEEIEKVLDNL